MTENDAIMHNIKHPLKHYTNNSVKVISFNLKKQLDLHHEFVKFAIVGLTTMLVDICFFYALTLSCMVHHPTIAKIIAGIIAMCVSYVLNSSWSFKNRGGRARQHEVILFFVISSLGIAIGAAPEFFVTSLTNWRSGTHNLYSRIFIDFILNYIMGNCAQMIFRFWALRKFAYPTSIGSVIPDSATSPAPVEFSPILWTKSTTQKSFVDRDKVPTSPLILHTKKISTFFKIKQDSQ